nr:lasso peptide biosynthesis B2 protein [uncultured Rhodoferax sp.]
MLNTLARKTRSFIHLPRFTKLWLLPLWLLLGISKALIFTISFRRLAPHLGQTIGVAAWVPLLDPAQQARAAQIGRAVRLTARYTPWNSNCFPQAVAARVLLGFYGIPYALHFGLMRDKQTLEMKAHAWVAAGRVPVTGGVSFGQFTVVGVFVASQLVSA